MPELILPLLSFSISMTITPGPNNVMVTASGVNFGYKKTLPHILGITFTFWQAVIFQWVNPKTWVMAVGAISTFTSVGRDVFLEVLLIAFVFCIVCFPCVSLWAFLGANIKRLLTTDYYRRVFNISMAFLLIISLLPVFL